MLYDVVLKNADGTIPGLAPWLTIIGDIKEQDIDKIKLHYIVFKILHGMKTLNRLQVRSESMYVILCNSTTLLTKS